MENRLFTKTANQHFVANHPFSQARPRRKTYPGVKDSDLTWGPSALVTVLTELKSIFVGPGTWKRRRRSTMSVNTAFMRCNTVIPRRRLRSAGMHNSGRADEAEATRAATQQADWVPHSVDIPRPVLRPVRGPDELKFQISLSRLIKKLKIL